MDRPLSVWRASPSEPACSGGGLGIQNRAHKMSGKIRTHPNQRVENHDLFCFFGGKSMRNSTRFSSTLVRARKSEVFGRSSQNAIGAPIPGRFCRKPCSFEINGLQLQPHALCEVDISLTSVFNHCPSKRPANWPTRHTFAKTQVYQSNIFARGFDDGASVYPFSNLPSVQSLVPQS